MILFDQAGAAAHAARMFAAPPSLRPFVEHVWTLGRVAASAHAPWRIIPDANPYLIFVVSDPASRVRQVRCTLVGPRSSFLDISVADRVFTCGIRLRPGVLPLLTRLPASEFVDTALPVGDAFGARGKRLLESLGESGSGRRASRLMAEFLAERLARSSSFQALPIPHAGGVHDFADTLGLSTRTLHHRVKQQVGVSPKRWLRIERVHRAIATSLDRSVRWSDIATHCGFADQAHMVREFIDLLGESPAIWSKRAPFLPAPLATGANSAVGHGGVDRLGFLGGGVVTILAARRTTNL